MAKISRELTSILNENKDPESLDNKSPALFVLLTIVTVAAVYFAALYYNTTKSDNKKDEKKYKKIYKENQSLKEQNALIQKKLAMIKEKKTETPVKIEKQIQTQAKIQEETQKEAKPLETNINTKKAELNKDTFVSFYNSFDERVLKCYKYEPGSYKPTNSCLNSLKDFLKNDNALRYQVIGVVSKEDINKYNSFKANVKELILKWTFT